MISHVFATPDLYLAVLLCALLLSGLAGDGGGTETETMADFSMLLVNVLFMLSLCAALLTYLAVVKKISPAEIFGLHLLTVRDAFKMALLYIIPLYIIVAVLAAVISQWALDGIWPANGPQETVEAFQKADGMGLKVLMGIAAVIVAPIVEETVFRGFVYGVIKRYTDGFFAAIVSSLLFAIVHLHVGSVVPLFMLALGLCLAYERTGSLLVPMWMHAIFNGTSTALILLGTDLPE